MTFVWLMQFAQVPMCKNSSVNAKCDKTQRSAILVLGARALLELKLRAELQTVGVLEEKPL